MMNTFKEGDKVTCIHRGINSRLTNGKQYTVVSHSRGYGGMINLINDIGILDSYYAYRFELLKDNLLELIEKAKALIGKNMRSIDTKKAFVPLAWGVGSKYTQDGWEDIEGSIVFVENENEIYRLDELEEANNEIKLTDDYNATIGEDFVKVGCQNVPIEKVREILKIWEDLYKH